MIMGKRSTVKILVCRRLLPCRSVMTLFKYKLNKHYNYILNIILYIEVYDSNVLVFLAAQLRLKHFVLKYIL
jgi:isoprenylcysteine carboxyl methyltransferase (ICMT) family protein YpbQ